MIYQTPNKIRKGQAPFEKKEPVLFFYLKGLHYCLNFNQFACDASYIARGDEWGGFIKANKGLKSGQEISQTGKLLGGVAF